MTQQPELKIAALPEDQYNECRQACTDAKTFGHENVYVSIEGIASNSGDMNYGKAGFNLKVIGHDGRSASMMIDPVSPRGYVVLGAGSSGNNETQIFDHFSEAQVAWVEALSQIEPSAAVDLSDDGAPADQDEDAAARYPLLAPLDVEDPAFAKAALAIESTSRRAQQEPGITSAWCFVLDGGKLIAASVTLSDQHNTLSRLEVTKDRAEIFNAQLGAPERVDLDDAAIPDKVVASAKQAQAEGPSME